MSVRVVVTVDHVDSVRGVADAASSLAAALDWDAAGAEPTNVLVELHDGSDGPREVTVTATFVDVADLMTCLAEFGSSGDEQ